MSDIYTKVQQLGKGSFGVATLYRRCDDVNSLVVVKEFDLSNTPRKTRREGVKESQV